MAPADFAAAIDMEQKYLPAQSTLSPADPDGDDNDEADSSPPDEDLEEGEVPLELAKQLLPTTQHM
jgi:hypothetical protein